MHGQLRVLLVEDHAVVRQGTRRIIEADPSLVVVGEASDGPAAIALAQRLRPDVVLLDIGLPGLNGIEVTRQLGGDQQPAVLILSAYDDRDLVVGALDAGARGYLLKTAHDTELVAAIHAVARGELVLHPPIAQHVLKNAGRPPLTPRELQILRMSARGRRTKDMAAELGITSRAVEAAVTRIFDKLGVSSRTEAIAVAMTRGLLGRERDREGDR